MFAIRAAEKNELVTPQDIDPNFTSQMVKMATYEAPGPTSPIPEPAVWQPNLTPYPTNNVMCVNCCRIVKTRTTYRPGPKGKKPLEIRIRIVTQIYFIACCLGSLSFLFGCWCLILLACSYFKWVHVKHYCPYCEYMIGEFRGQNNIRMNYEATSTIKNNSSDTEDNWFI